MRGDHEGHDRASTVASPELLISTCVGSPSTSGSASGVGAVVGEAVEAEVVVTDLVLSGLVCVVDRHGMKRNHQKDSYSPIWDGRLTFARPDRISGYEMPEKAHFEPSIK
jgi:hypothetical protein